MCVSVSRLNGPIRGPRRHGLAPAQRDEAPDVPSVPAEHPQAPARINVPQPHVLVPAAGGDAAAAEAREGQDEVEVALGRNPRSGAQVVRFGCYTEKSTVGATGNAKDRR